MADQGYEGGPGGDRQRDERMSRQEGRMGDQESYTGPERRIGISYNYTGPERRMGQQQSQEGSQSGRVGAQRPFDENIGDW
jgi:hypothetical protein